MVADEYVEAGVRRALERSPLLRGRELRVQVRGGAVTLTGKAGSMSIHHARMRHGSAELDAKRVGARAQLRDRP